MITTIDIPAAAPSETVDSLSEEGSAYGVSGNKTFDDASLYIK